MKNDEIADIFEDMADLLEIKSVQWKPRAYRNAARGLRDAKDIVEILKRDGKKGVMKIPGVGEHLANKIIEYIKTGKIKEYNKLAKKMPKGVLDMMQIMGMGPKKAWRLYKEKKIKSVKELEQAAKKGKIRKLTGFGEKSEEDIIKGVSVYKKGQGRMLLGQVWPIGQEVLAKIKKIKGVERAEIAGSLRRKKETIKDIDILVISKKPKQVIDAYTKLPNVSRVLSKGPTRSDVRLKEGLNANIRVLDAKSFGAAMQYFTGSKAHNIALRQIAIKKGFKLSEYGLFKGKTLIAGKTEQDIYKKLGLQYIEPELRENTGEIEAAKAKKLPKLIPYGSIKGDLQTHTKWSDGVNTSEEMIKAAISLGYKYFAITDHSKSEYVANGMDEKRLTKYISELKKLKKKYAGKIKVLIGAEVDILKDGKLDYSDKFLKELDVVVAAVHSGFKKSKAEMTKRIIKAIENKNVTVFAHPTGRLIGTRSPYEVDLDKVFEAAKANKVILEINAHPNRLDLNDVNAKLAIEKGLKLIINTDAHSTETLKFMQFGIAQARRGWAGERDIINTLPWNQFKKYLNK